MSELQIIERKKFPYKGRRLWKLILTTCKQGSNAPIIDHAWTHDREGYRYTSIVILLKPWLKDKYGEHKRQRALVIGWRT